MNSNLDIIVYTHKGCPGGDRAISYFHDNGISIQVKDIMNDPQALDEFQKQGCFATPVIVIDGKQFVGFDEDEIESLLHQNPNCNRTGRRLDG